MSLHFYHWVWIQFAYYRMEEVVVHLKKCCAHLEQGIRTGLYIQCQHPIVTCKTEEPRLLSLHLLLLYIWPDLLEICLWCYHWTGLNTTNPLDCNHASLGNLNLVYNACCEVIMNENLTACWSINMDSLSDAFMIKSVMVLSISKAGLMYIKTNQELKLPSLGTRFSLSLTKHDLMEIN